MNCINHKHEIQGCVGCADAEIRRLNAEIDRLRNEVHRADLKAAAYVAEVDRLVKERNDKEARDDRQP